MYRPEDYPQIRDHLYLKGRGKGASKVLTGKVALITVYMSRKSSDWSESVRDAYVRSVWTAIEALQKEIEELDALLKSRKKILNIIVKELDAIARKVISRAGFGKYFGHALGHGVGLDIHELPVASKRSDTVLKPGMLVTIEPGIYIEGELGVRIEDLVLVTKEGCEVLSSSRK